METKAVLLQRVIDDITTNSNGDITAVKVRALANEMIDSYVHLDDKDATGGVPGLTLFKINFKNALNNFTSFFTNANTAARTYTFQDRDGTISDDTDLGLKLSKNVVPVEITVACSDETTVLGAATSVVSFRMPYAMTLAEVRASLNVAGTTSGITTIDINENGTTILSTKLTIDLTELTSTTAATAAVISDSALADDSLISVDIDAISTGTVEAGLKITLIGTRSV